MKLKEEYGMIQKLLVVLICLMVLSLSLVTAYGEVSTPKPEDSMVTITGSFPLYSDPAVGSNGIEALVLFNLYDPLVFPTLDGQLVPHLATDWKVSSDELIYTFNLRKGV